MTDLSDRRWPWIVLVPLLVAQFWVAHLIGFFPHEYANSVTAWLLGWKTDPFGLHFPPPTAIVWLIQLGINQNVDEAPIFASGHCVAAGIIGLAGPLIGNALLGYPLSRLGYAWATRKGRRDWAMLAYWVTAASIGNLFDYVPIRTFTLEGDMGSVQRGFGWSPWTVIAVFGIPTAILLAHFLLRIVPSTLRWLAPGSIAQRVFLALVTAFVVFGFFGAAGWDDGGPISHRLSVSSVFVLFPAAAILETALVWRSGRLAD